MLEHVGINFAVRYRHIGLNAVCELFIGNGIALLLQIRRNTVLELIAVRSGIKADLQCLLLLCGGIAASTGSFLVIAASGSK
ncbi:hypothetical protein D3C81_2168450 [compost metagenome]